MRNRHLYLFLLFIFICTLIWSGIQPTNGLIWFYESSPSVLLVLFLILTYRRFPLTPLTYSIIFFATITTLIGAHYTYAEVPLFQPIQKLFDFQRNHFDRIGHFLFGMTVATLAREFLLNTQGLRKKSWLTPSFLVVVLALSTAYELLEFFVGLIIQSDMQEFLGTQGDIWDSHWDIVSAFIGANALWMLGKWQDQQREQLSKSVQKSTF